MLKTGFAYLGVILRSPAEIKGSDARTKPGYKVCVPGVCIHAGGQNKSETSLKYRARHTLCTGFLKTYAEAGADGRENRVLIRFGQLSVLSASGGVVGRVVYNGNSSRVYCACRQRRASETYVCRHVCRREMLK